MEEIEEAVTKDVNLSRKLVHGILIGPTGAGKSSLMDRLLGRKRRQRFSPSTGVSESVVMIDVSVDLVDPSELHSVTVMEGHVWKKVEFDASLARQVDEGIAPLPKVADTQPLEPVQNASPKPTVKTQSIAIAPAVRDAINLIARRFGGGKRLKHFLKKSFSLYLRDTGGQVEFQEMLPLLISAWSLHLLLYLQAQSRLQEEVQGRVQEE